MDLSNLKPSAIMVDILHPGTGEKLGITVSLSSLMDEKMKKVKRRIQDNGYALQRKGKGYSAEEIDVNTNLIVFTAMDGWSWSKPLLEEAKPATDTTAAIAAVYGDEPSFHGEKPAFTQANVYKVFNELPWFREQLEEKTGETKSFFQT